MPRQHPSFRYSSNTHAKPDPRYKHRSGAPTSSSTTASTTMPQGPAPSPSRPPYESDPAPPPPPPPAAEPPCGRPGPEPPPVPLPLHPPAAAPALAGGSAACARAATLASFFLDLSAVSAAQAGAVGTCLCVRVSEHKASKGAGRPLAASGRRKLASAYRYGAGYVLRNGLPPVQRRVSHVHAVT